MPRASHSKFDENSLFGGMSVILEGKGNISLHINCCNKMINETKSVPNSNHKIVDPDAN